jgi:dienelactone hydrolase
VRRALRLFGLGALVLLLTPRAEAGVQVKKSRGGWTYSLRVPEGWDRPRGGLLVVGFHGRGQSHDVMMKTLLSFDGLKDAVLAAPDAPRNALWGPDDLAPAADLLAELAQEHHATRTVGFGFSAGAYFVLTLGCMHPDKLAAAIAHSGGIAKEMRAVPVLPNAKFKEVAFYLIHGDHDSIVDPEESRQAVKRLKEWGVMQVEYEEVKGLDHLLDPSASTHGFAWVEKHLGPLDRTLPDGEAAERLKVLSKAIKANDADAIVNAFGALAGLPRRFRGAAAALAKGQFASPDERIALAAIACAGGLGEEGVLALKGIAPTNEKLAPAAAQALGRTWSLSAAPPLLAYLTGKPTESAVAAARALGELGGDPSVAALVQGLAFAEQMKEKDDRSDAISTSLKKLTRQSFEKAAEWKRWLAERDAPK